MARDEFQLMADEIMSQLGDDVVTLRGIVDNGVRDGALRMQRSEQTFTNIRVVRSATRPGYDDRPGGPEHRVGCEFLVKVSDLPDGVQPGKGWKVIDAATNTSGSGPGTTITWQVSDASIEADRTMWRLTCTQTNSKI